MDLDLWGSNSHRLVVHIKLVAVMDLDLWGSNSEETKS